MSFTWEWALAIFVFLFANLFLGVQLLKLFWPLRMLKLTAKMRKEAVDPQSWLGLAADENAVRAALPIREAIFLLQKGTLSEDEVKYRKLWLRSWVYTIMCSHSWRAAVKRPCRSHWYCASRSQPMLRDC